MAIPVYLDLIGPFGGSTDNQTKVTNVNGDIQQFVTYVQNGNTHVSIEVGGTYYYATPNSLPFNQWVEALQLKFGQTVQLQVEGQRITQLQISQP